MLADLVELLTLERLEVNLFRGQSRDIGSKQVYGGQVLGQALAAATYTVDDARSVHSLHAYFLRRGDMEAPIVYEVDRQRDGGSFSNRRVVAIQHGKPILNMACSFHKSEEGIDHADQMPRVPAPEDLLDIDEHASAGTEQMPPKMRRFLTSAGPFQFRPVAAPQWVDPSPQPPKKAYWFRASGNVPNKPTLQQAMLAYLSDYGLMTTAMMPHALSTLDENIQLASLDHAMWYHRPFDVNEWMLYSCRSSSASGARGLSRGQIFSRTGLLVAETMQEGLIRRID